MHNVPAQPSPIKVFSDGGALGNPGPGGYGVVIEVDGDVREISQGYRLTTNNRMELLGAITALASTADIAASRPTTVTTDSRYVVDAMGKGWAERWRDNGWMRNKRERALNSDLWQRMLDEVNGRDVSFEWVKGHAGHPQNERCDELVRSASNAPSGDQLEDFGYTGKTPETPAAQPLIITEPMQNPTSERTESPELTHLDPSGRARMVDVGAKDVTERTAVATCEVHMSAETLRLILTGGVEKGDVIATAKIAGINAAKRTHELIPMCHNVPLNQVDVRIDQIPGDQGLRVASQAKAAWRTGVEMEAMTACAVAALTIYDMCKSAERGITISELRLRRKTGGKSGDYIAD